MVIISLPCSHYSIVVINVTETGNIISPDSIGDDQLVPYNGPGPYYVTAVILADQYDPSNSYQLGTRSVTIFEGKGYKNVPLLAGSYRYFIRAFTIGPV